MRRLAIASLVAVVALGAACSAESVGPPPAPPVGSLRPREALDAGPAKATAKERAAAEAYTKALSSQGFADLGATLNEDAHFAFGDKDAHGRDRVVKAHDALFGAFDPRKFAVSRVWLTDGSQALEWTMTGVQVQPWMGVPATNKTVTFKGITLLWTKDDGTIADVHVELDQAVVKGQLGVGAPELQRLAPPVPPSGPPQVFEQTGAPEEAANVATVRDALQALEDNKEDKYVGAFADDVQVDLLDHAQPLRGKEDLRTYFKNMRKAVGALDTIIQNAWGTQSFAVVEYSITGEQLGTIDGIPPARSRLFRMHVVDVAEVRGGKIAHVWRFDDPSEILSQ